MLSVFKIKFERTNLNDELDSVLKLIEQKNIYKKNSYKNILAAAESFNL